MIDQSTGVEASKPHHTHWISLLLTLILGSASDLRSNKDILLVVGFNFYNTYHDQV